MWIALEYSDNRLRGRRGTPDDLNSPMTKFFARLRPPLSLHILNATSTMLRSTPLRTLPRTISRSLHSSSRLLESDLTHPALVADPPVANPSSASDPWPLKPPPLPETPSLPPHIKTMSDLLATPHPEGRDNEPTETLRKRLVYESRKRGILEMDLILSTFAKERLSELDDRQLREYDRVRLWFSPSLLLSLSLYTN